jgi:hypothetical protein
VVDPSVGRVATVHGGVESPALLRSGPYTLEVLVRILRRHRLDIGPLEWPVAPGGSNLRRPLRDNTTSTEHAVRRLITAEDRETLVPFDGFDSHVAYRLYPQEPGWLDVDEAGELAVLAGSYWNGPPLPDRVGRALRRVESVTRERYLEDALPLVVGGLESLVTIGRKLMTAQFSQRVSALARDVGVSLTERRARGLYDDRSALVHGAGVDLSEPHDRSEFEQGVIALQETLRRTVRRALEEPGFAAEFETPGSPLGGRSSSRRERASSAPSETESAPRSYHPS